MKRWVTYCNPSYIRTGGALYWTLWVLPLTLLCKRSPTEIFINVASPRGRAYMSAHAIPQYIRPHLPTSSSTLFSEQHRTDRAP